MGTLPGEKQRSRWPGIELEVSAEIQVRHKQHGRTWCPGGCPLVIPPFRASQACGGNFQAPACVSLSGWSHIWLAVDDSGHPDPRKQWPCLLRLPQMAINRANRKAASDAPVRPPPASRAASLRLCQGSRARSQSYWDFCPPLLVAPQPSLGHMGPFLFFFFF